VECGQLVSLINLTASAKAWGVSQWRVVLVSLSVMYSMWTVFRVGQGRYMSIKY
jgi:hypothetical protein